MLSKDKLRKKFLKIRKLKYFEVTKNYFNPLNKVLNSFSQKKEIYLSIYYPSNYEVNTLSFLEILRTKKKIISLLPSLTNKNNMVFCKWNYLDVLKVNKYGMLEPAPNQDHFIPDIMLVPLLVFDKYNHRLGYGKGYYDNFLNKYLKKNKTILTIGVAFSFQKYDKLPVSSFDVKMNYILTEKGIIKK